jgi:hypothetical protein
MDGGYEMFADPMFDFTGLSVYAESRARVAVAKNPRLSVDIAVGNVAVPLDPAAPPVPDVVASPPLEGAAFFAHASMLTCMAARGQDPGPHFWARSHLQHTASGVPISRYPATGWTRGKHVCT